MEEDIQIEGLEQVDEQVVEQSIEQTIESVEVVETIEKKLPWYKKIKPITWWTIGVLLVIAMGVTLTLTLAHPRDTIDESAPVDTTASVVEDATEEMEIIPETSMPETEPIYTESEETTETPSNKPTKPAPEAPSEPVTDEYSIDPPTTEREMLACVIYQEAGGNGSCDDCRRYVGDIVLNRVNDPRFPDTMEKVLTSKKQYGRFYWTGIKWPKRAKYKTERKAVIRAYRIADELLSGNHSKLYGEGYIWQAGFKQGRSGFWCHGHYYGKS